MRKLTADEKLELIQDAILPHAPLKLGTTLDEIDFDSLDAASVAVMATENTDSGAVEVDERKIQRCKTVADLIWLIWPKG